MCQIVTGEGLSLIHILISSGFMCFLSGEPFMDAELFRYYSGLRQYLYGKLSDTLDVYKRQDKGSETERPHQNIRSLRCPGTSETGKI